MGIFMAFNHSKTHVTEHEPMKLFGAKQSQLIDQFAIHTAKIPSFLLMKRAAWFSMQTLLSLSQKPFQMIVLCGGGNNGGDGWLVAQYAKLAGIEVTVHALVPPEQLKNDAKLAYQEWQNLGGDYQLLEPNEFAALVTQDNPHQSSQSLPAGKQKGSLFIIDALFGTGLNRSIPAELAQLFKTLNRQTSRPFQIIALDTPSGLNVDTGQIWGAALQADYTLSFLTHKFGFYTAAGADICGKVYYSDLQLTQKAPEALQSQHPIAQSHTLKHWLNSMPKLPANAHKGLTGTCVLIGGNHSMIGAIQLAANAALATGCGLCKVITRQSHATTLAQTPEIMCYPKKAWQSLFANCQAIAIGPGLGQNTWAKQLWENFLKTLNRPVAVIDADALNLLAKDAQKNAPENLSPGNWILTPHPAEAARLLGCSTQVIQQDRIQAIKKLHQIYGGTIVLKGYGTLIFDGKQLELCRLGNIGMAKGGMGDVLTGTICSLLAQGLSAFNAACLGVYLHSASADNLMQNQGRLAVLPSKIAQGYSAIYPTTSLSDLD